MGLNLVPDDKVKGRSGHAGAGNAYGKYRSAAANILPFLFEQLKTKQLIRVKNKDIAEELGSEFSNKSPTSIYWALKYVLYYEGIWVGTATHEDGSEILTFRKVGKGEKLPSSLAKKEYKLEEELEKPGNDNEDEKVEKDEKGSEDEARIAQYENIHSRKD